MQQVSAGTAPRPRLLISCLHHHLLCCMSWLPSPGLPSGSKVLTPEFQPQAKEAGRESAACRNCLSVRGWGTIHLLECCSHRRTPDTPMLAHPPSQTPWRLSHLPSGSGPHVCPKRCWGNKPRAEDKKGECCPPHAHRPGACVLVS